MMRRVASGRNIRLGKSDRECQENTGPANSVILQICSCAEMNTISDFRNNEYDFVIDPGRIMKTPRPEVKPHDSSL